MARKGRRTKEEYLDLVKQGYSVREISRAFGICEGSVKENLILYGINTYELNQKYFESEENYTMAVRRIETPVVIDKRTGKRYRNVIDLYVE